MNHQPAIKPVPGTQKALNLYVKYVSKGPLRGTTCHVDKIASFTLFSLCDLRQVASLLWALALNYELGMGVLATL